MTFPPLPKSYKGVYPFRLGTTSFIYPDHIIPNVRMLGPYIDEIEVLLFESGYPDSLPSKTDIDTLVSLADDYQLRYNVHLPIDIALTDPDRSARHSAVEIIQRFIDRTHPLGPSTCTLHLPYAENDRSPETVKRWQGRARRSLSQLLSEDIDSTSLSIETLDYPFEWVDSLLEEFNLRVCLDLGHLVVHGFDCLETFDKYSSLTSILHLHGVEKTRDHLSLDRMEPHQMPAVMSILRQFTGVLSLEVFSYRKLTPSLKFLETCWRNNELTP